MSSMTIGELARRGGVGIETVRYYQRRKLLEEPPRHGRGFRQYSDETLRTLRFIRRAKGLGFTLKEISKLLALRAADRKKSKEQLLDVLMTKRADLERQVSDLQIAIRSLGRLTEQMAVIPAEERWSLMDPTDNLPPQESE
jgi:MerR family mercuric resistance operon transcriptional regulator